MFDTSPEGIKALVNSGESDRVEFKSYLPSAETIGRVLSAFANTQGGILLIGVHEQHGIVGVPRPDAVQAQHRLQRVASVVLPWPTPIGRVDVDGRTVVYLTTDAAPQHLAPITTSTGEAYVRDGDRTAVLPPERVRVEFAAAAAPRVAFVAMALRSEEEPALVDYWRAMQRAVMRTSLPITLRRIDLVEGDYEISQEIMDGIRAVDLVIADFTLGPPNVYFEAGFARGCGKPLLQLARQGTSLQFDVRNWRTLFYKNATELEEKLIPALVAAVKELASK